DTDKEEEEQVHATRNRAQRPSSHLQIIRKFAGIVASPFDCHVTPQNEVVHYPPKLRHQRKTADNGEVRVSFPNFQPIKDQITIEAHFGSDQNCTQFEISSGSFPIRE